jgi:hypothetical protein
MDAIVIKSGLTSFVRFFFAQFQQKTFDFIQTLQVDWIARNFYQSSDHKSFCSIPNKKFRSLNIIQYAVFI